MYNLTAFKFIFCFLIVCAFVLLQVSYYVSNTLRKQELAFKQRDYFAICMVVRDDDNMVEWVDYHLQLGTSKIYVHDHNNDTSILASALKPYIDDGRVRHIAIRSNKRIFINKRNVSAQMFVYETCLHKFRKNHQFIGFIDSDEFIVLGKTNGTRTTIASALKRYENVGGVTLNWMVFGSSGHIAKPPGGVIANYHKCYPERHVKSIVNTNYVRRDGGQSHSFKYVKGYYAVDTMGNIVEGLLNPPLSSLASIPTELYSTMHINHYHTKSQEEFIAKINRGRFTNTVLTMDYFHHINSLATGNCSILTMPGL